MSDPGQPPDAERPDGSATPPGSDVQIVYVSRSGGFAGLTLSGEVDLDALDDDERLTWQGLLTERLAALAPHQPAADRFVYRVQSPHTGLDITVGDHELPDDLRELLDRVIHPPS